MPKKVGFLSTWADKCQNCPKPIRPNQLIIRVKDGYIHADCRGK